MMSNDDQMGDRTSRRGGWRLRDIWTAVVLASYGGGAILAFLVGVGFFISGVTGKGFERQYEPGAYGLVPYELSHTARIIDVIIGASLVLGGCAYYVRAIASGTARVGFGGTPVKRLGQDRGRGGGRGAKLKR